MSHDEDRVNVARLLGRQPLGNFDVAVRDPAGMPAVIQNAPQLHDGRPMPTRHWLLDPVLSRLVGRLESVGGVDQAEAAVGLEAIDSIHNAARAERHRASTRLFAVPDSPTADRFDHPGGVGGTRVGVKCLHAHVAEWLAHGNDAVGEWAVRQLDLSDVVPYQRVEADGSLTPIRWPGPVGAIDIGTNTMSLLIADGDRQLVREVRFPKLGEGIGVRGRISSTALDRAIAVALEYRSMLDAAGVTEVAAVATAAARAGSNGPEAIDAIGRALGAEVLIIGGDVEAGFAFAGAVGGISDEARRAATAVDPHAANETAESAPSGGASGSLVVDIGGGSTELTFGRDGVEASVSMPIGAVNLSEEYLLADPPLPEELSTCVTVARAHVDEALGQLPAAARHALLIGIAGTVTTSAAVEIGLLEYDRDALHGFVLTKAAAEDVFRTLATETVAQRLDNPGMFPGRERVIVGGCCVLVSVLRALGAESILVSEANLLDGLAAAASASRWPVATLGRVSSPRPGGVDVANGADTQSTRDVRPDSGTQLDADEQPEPETKHDVAPG